MPRWNPERKAYEEETDERNDAPWESKVPILGAEQREETSRTALLNELYEIGRALRCLDRSAS